GRLQCAWRDAPFGLYTPIHAKAAGTRVAHGQREGTLCPIVAQTDAGRLARRLACMLTQQLGDLCGGHRRVVPYVVEGASHAVVKANEKEGGLLGTTHAVARWEATL